MNAKMSTGRKINSLLCETPKDWDEIAVMVGLPVAKAKQVYENYVHECDYIGNLKRFAAAKGFGFPG